MWLGCLVVPVISVLGEPSPVWRWLGVAGVLLLTVAHASALHAAATPSVSERHRRLLGWGFAAATVLSIFLVAPAGPDDRYTWAWIGGATAGFVPLLLNGVWRWVAAASTVVVAVGVGAVAGGSPLTHGVIAASIAASVIATTVLPFRLWHLLLDARAGREAVARLAVSEERLRFARDVHDLLGHRLAVIALKAELASRLSGVDPARSAAEAAEVRSLASSALTEVREAVHGYRAVDLGDQLVAVENVLRDAGIRCTTSGSPAEISGEVATQLALALREGCTNVLRHSAAAWCTIDVSHDAEETRMTIANDGAGTPVGDRLSFGLRGTSERLAAVGGTVRTSSRDGVFILDVVVPAP
ncbi:histidine kinase [Lentzea tibetensis]|uniref:Histidine kinase n=2 Tax=Lentzea tibetensis TaxID=2591470 RepID=A0A563EUS4_9PSEU|nr:histidine kinase [Lentzea tibetensis]